MPGILMMVRDTERRYNDTFDNLKATLPENKGLKLCKRQADEERN